jgi:hypothetical protein
LLIVHLNYGFLNLVKFLYYFHLKPSFRSAGTRRQRLKIKQDRIEILLISQNYMTQFTLENLKPTFLIILFIGTLLCSIRSR